MFEKDILRNYQDFLCPDCEEEFLRVWLPKRRPDALLARTMILTHSYIASSSPDLNASMSTRGIVVAPLAVPTRNQNIQHKKHFYAARVSLNLLGLHKKTNVNGLYRTTLGHFYLTQDQKSHVSR